MGRITEIIQSGRAPGFLGIAKDPGSPQVAIPKALRAMEDEYACHSREIISSRCQYDANRLKEIWFNGRKKRKHVPKHEN